MRIIFWQNMLAIHQSAHIRALAASDENDVTLVVQEPLDVERQKLGWSIPNFGRAVVVVAPSDSEIERLVQARSEESIHIFSAIHAFPVVEKAFFRCLSTKAEIGLLVESQDFRGPMGLARLLRTRIDAFRYGKRISFILAMGEMGVTWFRRCGFPKSCVFPYGYFVEIPAISVMPRRETETVQLIYLGQLIPRKGVDTLLSALGALADQNWSLTIMGDGPAKPHLTELIDRLRISERVSFLPVQSNAEAVAQIARHDLFILPSRFDGWGAVINEALMCGVPVLCSDNCGAAELLEETWRGEVFAAGSVRSLKSVLKRWIARGRRTPEEVERLRDWSCCLEGKVAAEYLLQVIRSTQNKLPRPLPPWRKAAAECADTNSGGSDSALAAKT